MNDNLARLEEARAVLEGIWFSSSTQADMYNLHDDILAMLDSLIAKVECATKEKEGASLQAWINGNNAHDWDRYQPRMMGDSVFQSKRSKRQR